MERHGCSSRAGSKSRQHRDGAIERPARRAAFPLPDEIEDDPADLVLRQAQRFELPRGDDAKLNRHDRRGCWLEPGEGSGGCWRHVFLSRRRGSSVVLVSLHFTQRRKCSNDPRPATWHAAESAGEGRAFFKKAAP
jgi:hypothetical protein